MYYFTFGYSGQLFQGGWVRINANTLADAQQKFKDRYGDKAYKGPYLNYAFAYREKEFADTDMLKTGNLGSFEHECIP